MKTLAFAILLSGLAGIALPAAAELSPFQLGDHSSPAISSTLPASPTGHPVCNPEKSKACGRSCISLDKTCHKDT